MTDSPKYLYYAKKDDKNRVKEVVQLRIADIFFVYMMPNYFRIDDHYIYSVICHMLDKTVHTLYISKKADCLYYLENFRTIDFVGVRGAEKLYNKQHVSIRDAVDYGDYPFFTDRTDFENDPEHYFG